MSKDKIYGVLMIACFALVSFYIASFQCVKSLSLSPLIIGIVIGMIFANTFRKYMPESWATGIKFCTKQILRTGIVLYGFRLTLTNVIEVGLPAIVVDAIIVCGTIFLGIYLGKLMKMDADTALMTSTGSAICGAAAVLGAEPVVKCESHKTAIAVSTVVIFGTISMFLYPIMQRVGLLDSLNNTQIAVYVGSTLHEVAHVAGAGNAIEQQVTGVEGPATITKMIRVIMLAPVLIIMSFCLRKPSADGSKTKINVPYFAFNFIIVICINTLIQNYTADNASLSTMYGEWICNKGSYMEVFDTFLLTMAMTALGTDTSIDKFRQAGAKPFYLAGLLYIWLVGGGYLLARFVVPMLS